MFDQINQDIKTAMKNREKEKLAALRYLKSMLMENKTSSKPVAELDVVIKLSKKLKDSMENYPAESEQHAKIEQEIKFLEPYLPSALTEEEVKAIISEIVGGMEKPNMGMVMKELTPRIKGRFDGKQASQMVKESLN